MPDKDKAVNDIDLIVKLGIITAAEKPRLVTLVENYHAQGGMITEAQHKTLSPATRDRLYKAYKDDGVMYNGGDMNDVAMEIYNNVGSCPYCGNSAPGTLDHFMHKGKWRALSLCRINLVPVCWRCNQKKSTNDSNLFVHPYYTEFPDGAFLTADCTIKGTDYLFTFGFDPSVVTDTVLLHKLMTQWEKLKLDERLRAAVTQFICSSVIRDIKHKEELRTLLPILLRIIEGNHGRNHWKSAVLRGCIDKINGPDQDVFYTAITTPANAARDIPV